MELDSLLSDEQLASCPVLILGNKIDKIGAAGEGEVRSYFNLHGKTTGQVINTKQSEWKYVFFSSDAIFLQ